MQKKILLLLAAVMLIAVATYLILTPDANDALSIASFEECAEAGYAVMESHPRQCRTPDGQLFVEELADDEERVSGGCIITGCSAHVCADEEVITTCEWREEYACYQAATCERQADGECGWTITDELTACLGNAL